MSVPSPFAPASFPDLPAIAGCGSPSQKRDSLSRADRPAADGVGGSDQRGRRVHAIANGSRAGTVVSQGAGGRPSKALIVNAGNANAFTGPAGEQASADTAAAVGGLLGCPAERVFVASTGVIGEFLPTDKLVAALPGAVEDLGQADWEQAARTIATTDTFSRAAPRRNRRRRSRSRSRYRRGRE